MTTKDKEGKMSQRRYAQDTSVPTERSKAEVEKLLSQAGATMFGYFQDTKSAKLMCELLGRRIKLEVPIFEDAQENRRQWRVLVIKVKCRLEELREGHSIDEVFMPFILLPGGKTVAEHVIPKIENSYLENKAPQFLLEHL